MHFNKLLEYFEASIMSDGVEAAKILMGCNELCYNEKFDIACGTFRTVKKIANLLGSSTDHCTRNIPVLTAGFLKHVYVAHGLGPL